MKTRIWMKISISVKAKASPNVAWWLQIRAKNYTFFACIHKYLHIILFHKLLEGYFRKRSEIHLVFLPKMDFNARLVMDRAQVLFDEKKGIL